MLIKDYEEWSNIEYDDTKFELINNTNTNINCIIVHHTFIPNSKSLEKNGFKQTLQGIQKSHIERGFTDIGYHYLIDLYGNIYKGRKDRHKGAHCTPNSGKIGIALIIDGENESITPEMYNSLKILLLKIIGNENLNPIDDIYGHKDVNNTKCPGKRIYPILKILKAQIEKEITRR